jgi:hypothetical protein
MNPFLILKLCLPTVLFDITWLDLPSSLFPGRLADILLHTFLIPLLPAPCRSLGITIFSEEQPAIYVGSMLYIYFYSFFYSISSIHRHILLTILFWKTRIWECLCFSLAWETSLTFRNVLVSFCAEDILSLYTARLPVFEAHLLSAVRYHLMYLKLFLFLRATCCVRTML